MKHPQWTEIFYLFKELEQQKIGLKEKKLSQDAIASTRQSMINSLNQLKNNLKQTLDDHCVHIILFGVVAFLDEEMQHLVISNPQGEWPTLQKHFFNVTNAGEIFFENVDEALEKSDLPQVVFEILYFLLKRGFKGRYETSPNRIAKYMDFIAEKIPATTIERKEKSAPSYYPLVKPKMKIWHLYAIAFVVIMGVYIGLNLHSNL